MSRAASPPASAAALRALRAALENACAFPQLRTLTGSNPSAMGPKRKAPIAGGLVIQVVGDEGYRVRLAPPASAAALRALRAALENACAFPQLRTLTGSNPSAMGPKRKAPIAGGLVIQVVGDEGCRVRLRRPLPLRACGPCVLRWKTLRVSSAPHPCGFESHEMGPNKNGPLSRTVSNSVVGDEGFEPPALCV